MRPFLFCLCLISFLLSHGQRKRDERRLSFLLDKEIDSLCINCQFQDCEVLLYNAHLFKQLEYLEMRHFNEASSFQFIKYFKSLKSLKLVNPIEFDLPKEVLKMKQVLRLKELALVSKNNVTLYSPGLGYYRKRLFLKNISGLKRLEIRNVEIGLANDIQMLNKLKRLNYVFLTGIGITLNDIEKVKKNRFKVLEVDEHEGNLNYNFDLENVTNRKRYWKKYSLHISDLRLISSFNVAVKSNAVPFQNTYYFGKPTINFERTFYYNSEYRDWFPFYIRKNISKDTVDDRMDTSQNRFTYFGKLEVGEKSDKFYSFGYKSYDSYLKSYDFYLWDTTSARDRLTNLNYSNGDLVLLQWKKNKEAQYYTKRSIGKEWVEMYQSRYTLQRQSGKNLFQLKPNKVNYIKGALKFDYGSNNDFRELNALRKFAFSFTHYSKWEIKKINQARILDAWFSYNTQDKKYYLNVKTINQIKKYEITWWNNYGSKSLNGFGIAFRRYEEAMEMKFKKQDLKRKHFKAKLMYNKKFDPSFKGFKQTHFLSEVEKGMTETYWLGYRERILKNEKTFILNASLRQIAFSRMLELQNFESQSIFKWRLNYNNISLKLKEFRFPVDHNLSQGAKLILVDAQKKVFTSFTLNKLPNQLASFNQNSVLEANLSYYFYLPSRWNNTHAFVVKGKKVYYCRNFMVNDFLEFEEIDADLMNYNDLFKLME